MTMTQTYTTTTSSSDPSDYFTIIGYSEWSSVFAFNRTDAARWATVTSGFITQLKTNCVSQLTKLISGLFQLLAANLEPLSCWQQQRQQRRRRQQQRLWLEWNPKIVLYAKRTIYIHNSTGQLPLALINQCQSFMNFSKHNF